MGDRQVRVATLPNCNFPHEQQTEAAYDGKTTQGPWAYMCEEHFQSNGVGLGLGRGQRLVLND
jgi:hypothetical protein